MYVLVLCLIDILFYNFDDFLQDRKVLSEGTFADKFKSVPNGSKANLWGEISSGGDVFH